MDKFNFFKDKKDYENCFIICSKKTLYELLCGNCHDKDHCHDEHDNYNNCCNKWDDNDWDNDKWTDDKWDNDKWTDDKWNDKTCGKKDKPYDNHNRCEHGKKDCCEKKCCEKDNYFDKF